MKVGMNTLLWTAAFGPEHFAILPRLKSAGFDGVEVASFDFTTFPVREVRTAVRDAGLDVILCSALTGRTSLVDEDAQPAIDFLTRGIEAAAELGAKTFVGPFCAPVGYLPGRRRNDDEWKRAVDGLRRLGPVLDGHNVTLAVEPLNRFETYFLNTSDDARRLMDEVAHERIGVLFDTFHSNIEDKSIGRGVRAIGSHLRHVHTCENDRGVPGSGHVEWDELFGALRDVNYDGWVVIESFGSRVPEIATAACIWRDLAPNSEDIAFRGLEFLRSKM